MLLVCRVCLVEQLKESAVRKTLLVLLGFVSGFLLVKLLYTTDAVSLYLAYRINGPKAIHFIEDLFAYQPGIAVSLLCFSIAFLYLIVENSRLESETEEEEKKSTKKNRYPP